jgi:hypothetical protein
MLHHYREIPSHFKQNQCFRLKIGISLTGRVKPKTINLVFVASPLSAHIRSKSKDWLARNQNIDVTTITQVVVAPVVKG